MIARTLIFLGTLVALLVLAGLVGWLGIVELALLVVLAGAITFAVEKVRRRRLGSA